MQMYARRQRLRQINHVLRPPGKRLGHEILTVEPHLALAFIQTSQCPQQRRFTTAIRPQQHGDLAARQRRDIKIINDFIFWVPGTEAA